MTHPQQLVLLDRWPHKAGDTVQRFYFRAKAPFRSDNLVFKSAKHTLTLPVRVLSWEEVLTERYARLLIQLAQMQNTSNSVLSMLGTSSNSFSYMA